MLTVGDSFPNYELTGVVSRDVNTRIPDLHASDERGQVAGLFLLAEGLHLCLSDRAEGLWRARRGLRRPRRCAAGR